ncbi:MAG: phosphodiester glycosidase family protein, partial [Bacteriovoracaceae bacterium]
MIKKLSLLLIAISSYAFSFSDTTSSEIVAPGVVHTQYTLPGPFTLDVLEVDITNPHVNFETYKPAGGLTKTTVQSAANDKAGHRVIGAVNGGFFSFETGWPIHNQLVNGKPVLGIATAKSSFVLSENKKVYIDRFNFSGTVFSKNGTSLSISESNTARSSGETVLYTSFKGSSTGTDDSGAEVTLQILTDPLVTNDTLTAVVIQTGTGNSSIPADGFVISGGSGAAAMFLTNNVAINDTLKIFLAYNSSTVSNVKRLTQLITGNGHLIKNGVPYPALGDYDHSGTSFNEARHPRTFVGTNADTSKVYLCTVDGRQTSSLGMNFTEMANFLITLGVKDAFNLDGGGSTTMVVRGSVVNSPSDPGGERSVANTLHVISTAPVGTLHFLDMKESRVDVFQGLSYQFHANGKDEYYNPLPLPAEVVWSCDTAIGTVSSSGLFSAKNANDSGWVVVRYTPTVVDSARVYVRIVKELRLYPNAITMVPGEQVILTIRGIDTGNNDVELEGNQVFTSITGTGIHYSADTRTVTALGFGKGTLKVILDTVTTSISYDFSGGDTAIVTERFDNLFIWKQDVTGTDPDNVFFGLSADTILSSPHAFRVFYSFPTADAALVSLITELPIASRPDSLYVKVYGNSGGHTFKLIFTDKNGEQFFITSPTPVTWSGIWQNVGFTMVNAKPVTSGILDFPITITQIQIVLGKTNAAGGIATGTIFLDDITVHFPNRTVAPSILYDFNSGITGWLQPYGVGSGQTVGVSTSSSLVYSTVQKYEGSGSGKWTLIDDAASSVNWNVRIARTTSAELASMLRGSYIGAWVWSNGALGITMRTVIRGGTSGLCQGPAFPVNHIGWK